MVGGGGNVAYDVAGGGGEVVSLSVGLKWSDLWSRYACASLIKDSTFSFGRMERWRLKSCVVVGGDGTVTESRTLLEGFAGIATVEMIGGLG